MGTIILELKNIEGKNMFSTSIQNIPSESELRNKASTIYFKCLLDFFNFIDDTKKLNEFKDEKIGLDLDYIENKFKDRLLIKSLKKKIIDIISDLHHACEIYLKSSILKHNPLRLLSKTTYFDKGENINFLNEVTLDAHQLFGTNKNIYGLSFFENSFDCNFEKKFDDYRKIRNKNIHSISLINELNVDDLKNMFLATFQIFNRNKKISKELYKYINIQQKLEMLLLKSKEDFELDSFFSLEDKSNGLDYRRKIHIENLTLINTYLSEKQSSLIFSFKKKSKKAICPNCEKEYRFTIENSNNRVDDCPSTDENTYMLKSIKSLVELNKDLSQCFSCGVKIKNNEIIEEYCNCCEKKMGFFKGRGKIKKTCLKCGCINELDFSR